MTIFIRILGASLAAFLLLGGIQEWRSLANGIFLHETKADELAPADKDAAAATVLQLAQLTSHFYGTAGDPRFAERLPASSTVIEEMTRDAGYVLHNQRVEEPRLMRMEVRSVDAAGSEHATVRTKEYWTTRYFPSGELRSDIVLMRYQLSRDRDRWRVEAWDPEEAR